jgi:predicted double-glycine peptidase
MQKSQNNKPMNYENENPSFNDSTNWIEISNKETKIYDPNTDKDKKIEVSKSSEIANLPHHNKSKLYTDTCNTQSYTHIPTSKDIRVNHLK